MEKWYEQPSDHQDVIISSRIRLARNMSDFPFESRMSLEDKISVVNKVNNIFTSPDIMLKNKMKTIDVSSLDVSQRQSLVEQHLISPEFSKLYQGRALFLSEDSGSSIMVNEEDHIRIQVLRSGMDLENALDIANEIDDIIDKRVDYSFDDRLGFLTGCPTNIGTGLRASVMLHLPLLEKSGYLSSIANNIVKLGLVLRGTYGEGTAPLGSIYQISNQVTLGISELNAIKNLESIVNHIISQERSLREGYKGYNLEDSVHRAYGILTNARMLSFGDFMDLSSMVRLGIDLGYIENVEYELLNELILFSGPAYLNVLEKKELTEIDSNYLRAKIVREKLLSK